MIFGSLSQNCQEDSVLTIRIIYCIFYTGGDVYDSLEYYITRGDSKEIIR